MQLNFLEKSKVSSNIRVIFYSFFLGFKEEYELDPSVWETPKPLGQMSR